MLFIVALILLIASIFFFFFFNKRFRKQEAYLSIVAALIALGITVFQVLTVIPAGNVGVVDLFGSVNEKSLHAGVNVVNPLASVIKYSVKYQEIKETLNVPSKEGLTVKLEISLIFHLNPEKAPSIYKDYKTDYKDVLLMPNFRSTIRSVTASYEAKALYTASRDKLADEILRKISAIVVDAGIIVDKAPLRQITLPARLSQAIEEKLQAEQESQRMAFVLKKEEQEAERKRIEAAGIRDFQKIVSADISDKLLQWKGIEATEKLANSNNSKIVIIGAGDEGLPVILGNK